MDLHQSQKQSSASTSGSDDGPVVPRLKTTRDAQRITYTYYSGEDGSAQHGPYCRDCMNQLFRDGKLAAISMVFVFTTLGCIPFPIRTLVFVNGMDIPFSIKDMTEDFLLMICSNCSQAFPELNALSAADADEDPTICTSSGRKRKIHNSPSKEKLPSIPVEQEKDTSANVKKRSEDVDDPSASRVSPHSSSNKQMTGVPSSPVTAASSEEVSAIIENSAVEANSTNGILHCDLPVEVTTTDIGTDLSTIVSQSAPCNLSSAVGILGKLMNKIDVLPTVVSTSNNNEGAQNRNKESSGLAAAAIENDDFCEIIEVLPANRTVETASKSTKIPDRAQMYNALEPSKEFVVENKRRRITLDEYRRRKERDMAQRKTELGFSKSALFSNTCQRSSDLLPIPPPPPPPSVSGALNSSPVPFVASSVRRTGDKDVPSMSISGRLQAGSMCPPKKIVAITTPDDRPEVCLSNSVTDMLKSSYGADKLIREDLLDSGIVNEALDSVKRTGYYNTYLIIPFFAGRVHEAPVISFEELYNSIKFMNHCGMKEYKQSFGKFMCELFPEIKNIRRCDYCRKDLTPDASGATYLSHFLSFDHIVKAMNSGCGFSRDFNSLKKCLLGFLDKIHLGYAKRLRGPKFAECIDQRQFSGNTKDFCRWTNRLRKYKQV